MPQRKSTILKGNWNPNRRRTDRWVLENNAQVAAYLKTIRGTATVKEVQQRIFELLGVWVDRKALIEEYGAIRDRAPIGNFIAKRNQADTIKRLLGEGRSKKEILEIMDITGQAFAHIVKLYRIVAPK